MTQVVQEMNPEMVGKFFDSYDLAIASGDYAVQLKEKAQKTAVKLRKKRTDVAKDIGDINKALWKDGVAPNPEKCQELYKKRGVLTQTINEKVKKAKCDPATVRNFSDASELYHSDARAVREEMRGSPIKASSKIDPKMLTRIIEMRASK